MAELERWHARTLSEQESEGGSQEAGDQASAPYISPTKQAWLETQRVEWANSRRRRSQATLPTDLVALPTDAEFEEHLKREWLRRLKDNHGTSLARRRNEEAIPLDGPLMPSDREVWLLQKRRERDVALRERRRSESEAQMKPEFEWEDVMGVGEEQSFHEKQEWLRRLKDGHEQAMGRRKSLSVLEVDALALDGPLMPSDREVWMAQQRRQRELALRERRRLEAEARLKPDCNGRPSTEREGVGEEDFFEDFGARADSTERMALEQVD